MKRHHSRIVVVNRIPRSLREHWGRSFALDYFCDLVSRSIEKQGLAHSGLRIRKHYLGMTGDPSSFDFLDPLLGIPPMHGESSPLLRSMPIGHGVAATSIMFGTRRDTAIPYSLHSRRPARAFAFMCSI